MCYPPHHLHIQSTIVVQTCPIFIHRELFEATPMRKTIHIPTRLKRLAILIFFVVLAIMLFERRSRATLATTPIPHQVVKRAVEYQSPESFEGFDNLTGVDHYIVPNIVHFVRFNMDYLSFVEYLCIIAAHKVQNPTHIYIHTNRLNTTGYYWEKLNQRLGNILKVKFKRLELDINGQRGDFHIWHYSDISRLQVLRAYGGIYLDSDTMMIRSLDPFRKYEMTIAWDDNQFLGNQIFVAHKNARFLLKYLDTYRHYDPERWYYNGGELPTTSVLYQHPELVHRVKEYFGVRYLIDELYLHEWGGWQDGYYTVHLLSRWRGGGAKEDVEETGIQDFDFNEENIKGYDRTFGQMARWVLYNTTDLLAKPIRRKTSE